MRVVAIAMIVACGGHSPPRTHLRVAPPASADAGVVVSDPNTERAIVGVQLTIMPPDAEVLIDDTSFGAATMRVIPLEPGLHQLVVQLEGYKPFRVELTVSNKTEHVTVRLEPIGETHR